MSKEQHILEYIEANGDRFLEELKHLLSIPSVSTDKKFEQAVLRTAETVADYLTKAGADEVEICETEGYPVVYAEKIYNPELPTVLVYGHYDVQPADPYELWDSDPFEPVVKDGNIFARGACDDKGQMFMHIKVLEYLNNTNLKYCNIKFMIEGEEEIGSPSLKKFLVDNKQKLSADHILISDTAMVNNETPSLITGLKGICYFDIEIEATNRDLHSGIYGGAIPNPLNIMCEMIGKLKNNKNQVTIPGFYDDLIPPTALERKELAKHPLVESAYLEDLGVLKGHGEEGFNTLERLFYRPTLDVNGLSGGYAGDGAKTVLPSSAMAKISMRLVPGQSCEKVEKQFITYFQSLAPDSVSLKINLLGSCDPVLLPTDSVSYRAATKAMHNTFGRYPLAIRIGGSIPIVTWFKELLGMNAIMLGFGLDSNDIHSPNEHFGVWNFFKGIETITHFYMELDKIAATSKPMNRKEAKFEKQ